MRKIALIEDDADLHELLRHSLEEAGYQFVGLHTGEGAVEFLRRNRPDLTVLDIMLPGEDGIEICRRVRQDPILRTMPVIFLTALASETDRVLGLEMGADDYVVKPFSVKELTARIRARLRSRSQDSADVLTAGPVELNRSEYSVKVRGKEVQLTATEFRLMEQLMTRPGHVFRRERLLDAVWQGKEDVMERTVDAYVVRLRNKVEDEPSSPRWIRSRRGVGYYFYANGNGD